MNPIREGTKGPLNKKDAHDLYSRYMVLALEARTTGDRALFEDYYQRAEYYLHLMNELRGSFPVTPTEMTDFP